MLKVNLDENRQRTRSLDLRHKLLVFLDQPNSSNGAFCLFCFLVLAIAASIISFFLSTVPSLEHSEALAQLEMAITTIFTLELVLRLVVATLDLRLLDRYFWIDAVVLAPSYASMAGVEEASPSFRFLRLLRLLRTLKLMRLYSGWRVLILALTNSWRALVVPAFAILMMTLLLSGGLFLVEELGPMTVDGAPNEDAFADGFDALWCVFWIMTTLGFDGAMGTGGAAGKCIIAVAILAGLVLTTMPITIVGEAFHQAWDDKEMIEVAMRVQEMLVQRGLEPSDLLLVFSEFDTDKSGNLDWDEFKTALATLHVRLPVARMRLLFSMFDDNGAVPSHTQCPEPPDAFRARLTTHILHCAWYTGSGAVGYHEFCRKLYPDTDWDVGVETPTNDKPHAVGKKDESGGAVNQVSATAAPGGSNGRGSPPSGETGTTPDRNTSAAGGDGRAMATPSSSPARIIARALERHRVTTSYKAQAKTAGVGAGAAAPVGLWALKRTAVQVEELDGRVGRMEASVERCLGLIESLHAHATSSAGCRAAAATSVTATGAAPRGEAHLRGAMQTRGNAAGGGGRVWDAELGTCLSRARAASRGPSPPPPPPVLSRGPSPSTVAAPAAEGGRASADTSGASKVVYM